MERPEKRKAEDDGYRAFKVFKTQTFPHNTEAAYMPLEAASNTASSLLNKGKRFMLPNMTRTLRTGFNYPPYAGKWVSKAIWDDTDDWGSTSTTKQWVPLFEFKPTTPPKLQAIAMDYIETAVKKQDPVIVQQILNDPTMRTYAQEPAVAPTPPSVQPERQWFSKP